MIKQQDSEVKCKKQFSEESMASPNAHFYQPRTVRQSKRKNYSFHSPHNVSDVMKNSDIKECAIKLEF